MNVITSKQTVMTRGVADLTAESEPFSVFLSNCLHRHFSGDWGDVPPEDARANNDACKNDGRVLSAYRLKDLTYLTPEKTLWIITEADRSVTTALFPSEY